MARKRRLAWFSPLDFDGTAVATSAETSKVLLPLLQAEFEIELFCNDFRTYPGFPTHHYLRAFERHEADPFDIFFYQIEEGAASHFVRFHASLIPGVVLFHDLIVWDSGPVPLYVSPWEQVVRRFHDRSVAWPDRNEKYHYKGPLLFREAAFAAVALFSTAHAHHEYTRLVHERIVTAPSYHLPFAVNLPTVEMQKHPRVQPCIAFCGAPRIESRAHKIAQALSSLGFTYKLIWLLDGHEESQARALLTEYGIIDAEIVVGRTAERWANIVASADIALHLFFSAYGQPGRYLAQSLIAGVPSIVSSFGTTEYLPDSVVCKIQPGESEATELCLWLRKLLLGAGSEELRSRIADRSRRYAREFHDARQVAQELRTVFNQHQEHLSNVAREWRSFEAEAKCGALAEAREILTRGVTGGEKELLGGVEYGWQNIVAPAFKELGWESYGTLA